MCFCDMRVWSVTCDNFTSHFHQAWCSFTVCVVSGFNMHTSSRAREACKEEKQVPRGSDALLQYHKSHGALPGPDNDGGGGVKREHSSAGSDQTGAVYNHLLRLQTHKCHCCCATMVMQGTGEARVMCASVKQSVLLSAHEVCFLVLRHCQSSRSVVG